MNLGGLHKMVRNTGWVSFASTASFSSEAGAGIAWSNPGLALVEDVTQSALALFFSATGDTNPLMAMGLAGSPVPDDAVILGVEVRYVRAGGSGVTDDTIQLVKNGVAAGNNKSVGGGWSSSLNEDIFGASSDLWGLELAAADVNAPGFGVKTIANGATAFQTAAIDVIQMRITYIA